jgi:hypothetical protein
MPVGKKPSCKRNASIGGGSAGIEFKGVPVDSSTNNNPLVGSSTSYEGATYARPGQLAPMAGHGLPGVQAGGRWGFVGDNTHASIPCESSKAVIPPNGASGSLNVQGGELWRQAGGMQSFSPSSVSDAYSPTDVTKGAEAALTVPTSRYENLPLSGPVITYPGGAGNLMVTKAIEPSRGGGTRKNSKRKGKNAKAKTKSKSKSNKKGKSKKSKA